MIMTKWVPSDVLS